MANSLANTIQLHCRRVDGGINLLRYRVEETAFSDGCGADGKGSHCRGWVAAGGRSRRTRRRDWCRRGRDWGRRRTRITTKYVAQVGPPLCLGRCRVKREKRYEYEEGGGPAASSIQSHHTTERPCNLLLKGIYTHLDSLQHHTLPRTMVAEAGSPIPWTFIGRDDVRGGGAPGSSVHSPCSIFLLIASRVARAETPSKKYLNIPHAPLSRRSSNSITHLQRT